MEFQLPTIGTLGRPTLPKLAIISSNPIQHFCPLYKALTQSCDFAIRVFFGDSSGSTPYFDETFGQVVQWQSDLLDGFEYEFLSHPEDECDDAKQRAGASLSKRLDAFRPDVIQIYGFKQQLSRNALRWAQKNQVPVLYQSDSEVRSSLSWRTRVRKRLVVPLLQRQVHAFLTVGDSNEEYYRRYGANENQLIRTPFPIDEIRYEYAWAHGEQYRTYVRSKLGIGADELVFLTVGKLTERKAIKDAILAFSRNSDREDSTALEKAHLMIVGSGEELEQLKVLSAASNSNQRIHFLGFVEAAELPSYYLAADLLLHPSSADPHPLVVTEAIATGLPVIASDRVGSIGPTDDIQIGINGAVFPCGDVEALESLMITFVQDNLMLTTYSKESRRVWNSRRMTYSVQGYVRAMDTVIKEPSQLVN